MGREKAGQDRDEEDDEELEEDALEIVLQTLNGAIDEGDIVLPIEGAALIFVTGDGNVGNVSVSLTNLAAIGVEAECERLVRQERSQRMQPRQSELENEDKEKDVDLRGTAFQ